MKSNSIIDGFRSKIAKVSYRDRGRDHILFGYVIGETEDSFIVKSDDFEDDVVIPKKQVTMILWPKNISTAPPTRLPPVAKEKKRSKRFSYARWWKYDDVKEAEP